MNTQQWKKDIISAPVKKAMPILSFPSIQLMGITVKQLISDSWLQADGMKKISEQTDSLASLGMMDLSVEAEAFGSAIRKSDDEVPTVTGRIIETGEDAARLQVPNVKTGRTGIYVKAIKKAAKSISDRPVLAGVIGPFSLASRLMEMSRIMLTCFDDPDTVHQILEKTSKFITNYIDEFKDAGASGIVMAEPAAGLLSPAQLEEFSSRYIKQIISQVKDDNFMFVYHNCGLDKIIMLPSITDLGADAYHFGNVINMVKVLETMPKDALVMGNISPSAEFRNGTPESIYAATTKLLQECSPHPNFIVSSGCDIPPLSPWKNIDSFFKAVKDFYG